MPRKTPPPRRRVNPSGADEITYDTPGPNGRPAGRRMSKMFPGTTNFRLGWQELQPLFGPSAPPGKVYVVSGGFTRRRYVEHIKVVPAVCKDEITEIVWIQPAAGQEVPR